jgi:hypothetical protein
MKLKPKSYKRLYCSDGFNMSVQASERNYCAPRDNTGPYTAVEIGFPSAVEKKLIPFAEDKADPLGTVYCWVPTRVLWEVITEHGGIESGELPPITIGGE